jgi:hypothetical protein
MRLVLFNAHKELWFGKTLKVWLYCMPWKPKYAFIIREHLRHRGPIYILLSPHKPSLVLRLLGWLHVKLWAAANGYNPLGIKVLFKPEQLKADDALLVIYVGNFVLHSGPRNVEKLVPWLNRSPAKIFLSVNHYAYHVDSAHYLLRELRFSHFWAENDLRKNSDFFRKHFADFRQDFLVTPFAVRADFKVTKNYAFRRNAAIAVGSVSLKMTDDRAFVSYFGHDNLQPIRDAIYCGIPMNYVGILDTVVSHINEEGAARPVRGAPNLLVATRNWLHNVSTGQRKYHAFNMCKLFNEYKVHVVGEEIVGLPGIGFAEGMMCGSACIGIDDPMYRVLGLEPNVHYIAYSGGYEHMLDCLEKALKDQDLLSRVAAAGYEHARQHFTEAAVFKKLMEGVSQKVQECL